MAAPGSDLWRGQITASKIPAMLGLSPWQSPYALWHEMAGLLNPAPLEGDHLDWGHDAEDALVNWWHRHNPGWQTGRGEVAYTDDDLPFPNQVTLDRRARRGRKFHIVECKTARDLDTWGKPGEPDSIPAYYHAQAIFQLGVSGIRQADIVVLGFGTPEIHPVEWNPEMFQGLVDFATDWWESLQTSEPPELDDSVATYEAVRGLHPDIEKGTEVQVDHDTALAYLGAVRAVDTADSALTLQKSRLAQLMGTAHKAMVGDTKIADRRARGTGTPYVQANKKADLAA